MFADPGNTLGILVIEIAVLAHFEWTAGFTRHYTPRRNDTGQFYRGIHFVYPSERIHVSKYLCAHCRMRARFHTRPFAATMSFISHPIERLISARVSFTWIPRRNNDDVESAGKNMRNNRCRRRLATFFILQFHGHFYRNEKIDSYQNINVIILFKQNVLRI